MILPYGAAVNLGLSGTDSADVVDLSTNRERSYIAVLTKSSILVFYAEVSYVILLAQYNTNSI